MPEEQRERRRHFRAQAHELCSRCHRKWRQDHTTFCRHCQRVLGLPMCNTREAGAARIARQQARIASGGHLVPADDRLPRATRTIVVDGVEYEIKWDGS